MKTLLTIFTALALTAVLAASVRAQGANYAKLGGERFDLDSQKGKVVVLAVGARWLPLSKNQAEVLNKLAAKYDAGKVSFYFVMVDLVTGPPMDVSTDVQLQDFAKANKLAATILRDPKAAVTSKNFKPDQLPAFIVLDKDGRMVGEAITGLDPKADNATVLAARIDKAVTGDR